MTKKVELDAADVRILTALQDDGTLSVAAMAEIVNLSHNACWRRIKRLEADGVIRKRVALLSPEAVGVDVTVFVHIRASEHTAEWLEKLKATVQAIPEVVEFYRMTGDIDYVLKLQVESIKAYDEVYKRLISTVKIVDVSSAFAMEELKHTTALPLRSTSDRA